MKAGGPGEVIRWLPSFPLGPLWYTVTTSFFVTCFIIGALLERSWRLNL